jgi:hypothetical protein
MPAAPGEPEAARGKHAKMARMGFGAWVRLQVERLGRVGFDVTKEG